MEEFIEIMKKNLTIKEIEKYDKNFLKNPIYRNFIIKHLKQYEKNKR